MTKVLVSVSCHNKVPKPAGLEQHTLLSHISGGWGVQDQGADGLGPGGALSLWFAASQPRSPCVLKRCREQERALCVSSYKGTNLLMGAPLS